MTTTKIETRHGVMAVDDSATDGFPVVFIHGNSASRSIFRHQVDAGWAGNYRMITLDLLGHGDSEGRARSRSRIHAERLPPTPSSMF